MSEDKAYKDGDIVWVKLGNNWWPAEVTGPTRHPEGLIKHLKRVPYCVVKFFNENTYEYVRNSKQIFPFQCPKQEEFIRKGYSLYNSGNTFMEKFPPDVEVAKQLTHRKETSLVINDRPDSIVKAILGQPLIRTCGEYYDGSEYNEKRRSGDSVTKILNITPKCNKDALSCEKPRTEKSTNTLNVPNDKTKYGTNSAANNNNSNYQCNFCDFSSVRLNVMILHRKMHSNRNTIGSNSSTLSKPTVIKSTLFEAAATTTKFNTERNRICNKDKTNSKTKVSKITTTAARSARGPSPVNEPTSEVAPVDQINDVIAAAESTVIPLKPKEKNNRISKVQTLTSKSKIAKKATVKEKKVESAYESILSDFCSIEMESSLRSEETQSRRSLRHSKHPTENTAEEVPTICIDLSETKAIQKIPKKREYTSLQLQTEITMPVAVPTEAEPDVVFLGDNEEEGTTINLKKDADDIRRMLLADWSDDDETPNDAIVVDDSIMLEDTESNICRSAPVGELHIPSAEVITSTPITNTSSVSTGRIRNIPKKDRRDVVLQDFNSDLTLAHGDNLDHAAKTLAVDLDSSNSSVVEIIEDQSSAAIITINDDEDQEDSKCQKHQNAGIVTENKDNDKSASAATSTTTLSCFDFQDDEEDQDNTNTSIPHFKKKYLSGDKLQSLSLTTAEESREDDLAESRAELAEKDQRLAAEIETLLEQTQPTMADLLNANSFEESMSVKDLPIKERGKRIFKSRNKTRMEDNKRKTELAVNTTADSGLTISTQSLGEYISNANTTESLVNDKDIMNNTELELSTDKEHEIVHVEGNVTNKICSVEISSQESSCIPHTEVPQLSEEKQITPSENKESEDVAVTNEGSAELSTCDKNTTEDQMEQGKVITSDSTDEKTDNEKSIEIISKGKQSAEDKGDSFKEQLHDQQITVYQQQDSIETNLEQDTIVGIDQTQEEPESEPSKVENIIKQNRLNNEDFRDAETNTEVVSHAEGNKSADSLPESMVEDPEEAGVAENSIKVLGNLVFKHTQENFKSDLLKESGTETNVPKSPEEIPSESVNNELNMFALETSEDNDINEILDRNGGEEIKSFQSDESCKMGIEKECSENIFKIRVKSPEQLLDQALVLSPQHEQELPIITDSNIDARIITGTPTDENSSMGASDTGAEFGSPTSMLSEERLPAFRFQSNQTPHQEIEKAETEANIGNVSETLEWKTHELGDATSGQARKNFLKFKEQMIKDCSQKSPQQRRYSTGLNYSHTEQNCFKRQRLSVDSITSNQENNFEMPQKNFLAVAEVKILEKVTSKRRHMKITPRRNVSELFNQHSAFKNHVVMEVEKNSSLENIAETTYTENAGDSIGNEQLKHAISINENCSRLSNDALEDRAETNQEVETNKTSLINSVMSAIVENKELENPNNTGEVFINSEENVVTEKLATETTTIRNEEDPNFVDDEVTKSKLSSANESSLPDIPTISEESQKDESKSADDTILTDTVNESVAIEDNPVSKSNIESTDESIVNMLDRIENIETDPSEISIITMNRVEEIENNIPNITLSFDDCKIYKNQVLEMPFSPGVPPPTPQEREVVIESEIINQPLNAHPEIELNIEAKSDMPAVPLTLNEPENSKEITNQVLIPKEKQDCLLEADNPPATPKGDEFFAEEVVCTVEPSAKEPISDLNARPVTPANGKSISETEILAESAEAHKTIDMIVELEKNADTSSPPKANNINDDYENGMQISCTPQDKDLIIECEPTTPQGIVECDHNIPTQITPEKEVIIESDISIATSTQDKDIIIEENLQLDEKETLLEREFQAIQPKESSSSVDLPQETPPINLQTDADKAAEEFLIEFDSIVNHSHTVDDDIQTSTLEDAINAEDLINNIIEEVHEDQQVKPDEPAKSEPILPYEPLTTYKVVTHKNSWNQIFKDSFSKQLPAAKRRQTICFEVSDTKERVACKKQAFDFESMLPVNRTIKRTAERKLTLPAIETKLSSNSQPHNIFALNHTQLTTLNKKLIPTAKRKLSIEDNITSFIIERPKQQTNAASGPPPLQRIRSLSRPAHIISRASIDNLSEAPPLKTNDNLFQEIFPSESTTTTDGAKKSEGGLVIHQQIISSPTISSTHQNKTTDAKISMNKQIGVDSRGNKYVIIKTPPTDIIVQPTLTSSTSAAVAATNNFGTTITIQPLARTTTDASVTNATTKSSSLSSSVATTSRKQQLQQISITVPAKSPLEISNSPEISLKNQSRNRRKSTQAKAVAATPVVSSNINSAKHRQAMEALSRRLSIASEAPSLAKMPRTSSTHVQTQISNSSNLATFFGDTQLSNIAQQQLIQLQQQQHQQHTQTSSPLPPPIILNKNAHQQSVMQRKARKIPQQRQAQQQQIIAATKTSQLQQQQQIQVQQQQHNHNQQMQQQQYFAQISHQQQSHNPLQPPPLQQIQPQPLPMQQQIVQQSDGIIITTAATEDDNVIDSNTQLIALSTQPYPGYSETFLLCKVKGNTCKPVDNVPLYLNQLNELVPVPLEAIEGGNKQLEHRIGTKVTNTNQQQLIDSQANEPQGNDGNLQMPNINCNLVETEMPAVIESDHQLDQQTQQQQIMDECVVDENAVSASSNQINDFAPNQEVNTELVSNNGILLNIEGQQVLLDAATFAHLLANPDANTQLISDDGTEYVLTHEVLAALQMQQEQQQALEPVNVTAQQQQLEQAAGTDIIAVALAGSDLYDSDVLTIDTSQGMQLIGGGGSIVFPAQTGAITQQHLTPPAVVTNAVLDQSPIMSTLEVPSSIATSHKLQGTQLITVPSHHLTTSSNAALGIGGRANLEDSLAAIGVTTQTSNIPSSLGLPITVTNPNIASKVTSAGPLNEMLQFVSHRPATAAATAAAVAAAALAGESRIFTD